MRDVKSGRPLIELAHRPEVNQISGFAAMCDQLTQDELVKCYQSEMQAAPQRGAVGKSYLSSSRQGIPSTLGVTNRREEHLALAIFNKYNSKDLRLPNGELLYLLDYQLPLKARLHDVGVGKIDLFGLTGSGRAAITELKAAGGKDTPLRALLEGLAYTAIVQAN